MSTVAYGAGRIKGDERCSQRRKGGAPWVLLTLSLKEKFPPAKPLHACDARLDVKDAAINITFHVLIPYRFPFLILFLVFRKKITRTVLGQQTSHGNRTLSANTCRLCSLQKQDSKVLSRNMVTPQTYPHILSRNMVTPQIYPHIQLRITRNWQSQNVAARECS